MNSFTTAQYILLPLFLSFSSKTPEQSRIIDDRPSISNFFSIFLLNILTLSKFNITDDVYIEL